MLQPNLLQPCLLSKTKFFITKFEIRNQVFYMVTKFVITKFVITEYFITKFDCTNSKFGIIKDICYRTRTAIHFLGHKWNDGWIEISGSLAHDESLQRTEPHRSVKTTSSQRCRNAATVAKVSADYCQITEIDRSGLIHIILHLYHRRKVAFILIIHTMKLKNCYVI